MKCLRCDAEMEFSKKITLRNVGEITSLLGALDANPVGEPIPVDLYCCPNCRKIEFFAPKDPVPTILCPHCGKEVTITSKGDDKDICPLCGKNFYEKVPGRNYIRPKNF